MKTGLIIIGVILLIIGGIFYFIPTPTASATTTQTAPGSTNTQVSSASLSLPWGVTVGILALGFVCTLLGLIMPGSDDSQSSRNASTQTSYDIKTTEDITSGKGRKQHIARERHIRRERTK